MAQVSEDPPSPVDAYNSATVPPPPPIAAAYSAPAPYAPATYGAPAQRTNTLAIVSLILSCAGLIFWFVLPIGGVVTGHIALSQIKKTGEGGHGLALTGVIVGYALIAISIIGIVLYIVFIVLVLGVAGTSGDFNSNNFG